MTQLPSHLKTDPLRTPTQVHLSLLEQQLLAELIEMGIALQSWNANARHCTPEEKAAAMRRLHLLDQMAIRFPYNEHIVL